MSPWYQLDQFTRDKLQQAERRLRNTVSAYTWLRDQALDDARDADEADFHRLYDRYYKLDSELEDVQSDYDKLVFGLLGMGAPVAGWKRD